MFSGALPSQFLRVLKNINCLSISTRTYYNHQQQFLHPAATSLWSKFQADYVEECKTLGHQLAIGGDGRADSLGHSAKFGSYTAMDLDSHLVVNIELVQSNEVSSSNSMEKEGLVRTVHFLNSNGLQLGSLVTDCHLQIAKWVKEELSKHQTLL